MRMMNDICHVEVVGPVEYISRIIQPGAVKTINDDPANPVKSKVYKGRLLDAGPGKPYCDGTRNPSLMLCPGFKKGATIYFLTAFALADLGNTILVQDQDVMAVEVDGVVYPAYDRVIVRSPRTGGPSLTSGGIHLVTEEKTLTDQPQAEGIVIAAAPEVVVKKGERIEEHTVLGVFPSPLRPGDRIVFSRFACWRIVMPGGKTDEHMLVMSGDVRAKVDKDVEIDLCS